MWRGVLTRGRGAAAARVCGVEEAWEEGGGQSRALLKYFEHAGALLTADGTDDDNIKLEGVAKGEELCI